MKKPRLQNTIARPVTLTGFGYWSGLDVTVQFSPAAEDSGIRFVRADLPGRPVIPAQIRYRQQSPRRTTIGHCGATVEMIEHIMAALFALEIDNCEILVNRAEMPGFDGSSQVFVEALDYAGRVTQSLPRTQIRVTETMRIGDDECSWIQIEPADEFTVSYHLDYLHPAIGTQELTLPVTPEVFRTGIAPARTFLLKHEADWLLQQGLGQRVSYQHVLVFGNQGPIDNRLRFEDECVRHKTLDLIGDFALGGHEILGHVTASRTGHRLNGEMIRRILRHGVVCSEEPGAAMARLKAA